VRRLALAALLLAFAVTLLPGPWGDESATDLPIYRGYAEAFLDGRLPYRDVGFEYPPLAAPLLALPGLVGTGAEAYRLAFAALALLLAGGLVLLVGALAERTGADRRRAMLAAAAAPLLCGALVRTRFDLAPVVLALTALLLLCASHPRVGFAVLGLGAATKGFPLVIAPVALAWLLGRGERRAALGGMAALALTLCAVGGAAVAISPSGALDALTYHLERPVQIESTPAVALFALDGVGLGEATVRHSFGSEGIQHPAAGALATLFVLLLAGAVALLSLAAARDPTARGLMLASLAAVAAFAVLGKVLSPQFLIWLLPLVPLVRGRRGLAASALLGVALVLTQLWFPYRYWDLALDFDAVASWLVLVRDLTLVALFAVLATPPARGSPHS
jgi:Glycosyltransferase family 87